MKLPLADTLDPMYESDFDFEPEEIPPCPYCEHPMKKDDHVVVTEAHGLLTLVHKSCAEEALTEIGEDDED